MQTRFQPLRNASLCAIVIAYCTSLAAEEVQHDYLKQVKPLLKERCYACHGALKQEGGLRLDALSLIQQGGDSGAVISTGDEVAQSLILQRVSATDPADRMPPEHEGEPLSQEQISILRNWIQQGAQGPLDEQPESDPRDHWAFRPIQRPDVPELESSWGRNPIDAFIAHRHQELGLTPQPEASRVELLRRLSFDLIGLPPTQQEIADCVNSTSPDWYEETVDRLLEDPRYGERWGRHWMDVWRYSDWWGLGEQLRNSQRHLWHWRDWIVESLNQDLPYDEMVRLMLAADELAPGDADKLRATGYLARNYYIFNRSQWLEEVVEHTSKGFLGLTMNCAKCHDHKFDPVEQVEYYQMRAFFEPYQVRIDMVPGEVDLNRDGIARVFDGLMDAPTWRFVRGDEALADKSHPINPDIPQVLEFEPLTISPVELPPIASEPVRGNGLLETHLAAAQKRVQKAEAELKTAEKALQHYKELDSDSAVDVARDDAKAMALPFHDLFAELDSQRWQAIQGGWNLEGGHLQQNQDGPQNSLLRLTSRVPRDFEATIRFRIHGGSRWRSVGIMFDSDGTGTPEQGTQSPSQQFVYVSGAVDGTKVQAAYREGTVSQYPSEGMSLQKIELDREYTLTVRANRNLISATLDGKPVISWRSPLPRRPGFVEIFTYDAVATFYEFRISELDPQLLAESQDEASSASIEAEQKVALARWNLKLAQAELQSVSARAAAMEASWGDADSSTTAEKRETAIRAEWQVALVEQQRRLETAQVKLNSLSSDDAEKKAEAEKELQAAKEAVDAAMKKVDTEVTAADHFTPLKGARWSATRFKNTGADDPEVTFPSRSTGRRTALARWIIDPRNPLTARVAVNHIWGRHFGDPIVSPTFDFGRNGIQPTHPELLDWLASELMQSGWKMKHLHRLIVTSSTYRMSSRATAAEGNVAIDPENRAIWRRNPLRLESQAVRDSLLALSGTLDNTMGGPPVMPNDQDQSHRRSLYFFHSSNERNLFLTTFDDALVSECYRREQSIVPQQALALLNSGLVLDSARAIAARISQDAPDSLSFVRNTFLLLDGIEATDREIALSVKALDAWKEAAAGDETEARVQFVWTLINHNDFVTVR
ncbi:PSD1 and planctomycete cytochrome C domain-containing protein [Planctomicrobium sp. SH661]|uniref:PSD1 and planctomycete cytochrome C domain-containing protein n=1 Tax=Planctomicrobium sp. SH661 TaxID=3448124 RepID=UPI003F5BEF6B